MQVLAQFIEKEMQSTLSQYSLTKHVYIEALICCYYCRYYYTTICHFYTLCFEFLNALVCAAF